jgi:hypothetical protein
MDISKNSYSHNHYIYHFFCAVLARC